MFRFNTIICSGIIADSTRTTKCSNKVQKKQKEKKKTCNPNAPISLYPSKVSGSISSFASFLKGSFFSYKRLKDR